MRPGHDDQVGDPADALFCSTSSARSKATLKVVAGFATRNRFWLGMTIEVSTCRSNSARPSSAVRARRCALEGERLAEHAEGENALFVRGPGDHRRGAGAGAAAQAGRDEAHMRALQHGLDLGKRLLGRGLAEVGARAGAEPFGDPRPQLDERRRPEARSAWTSVLATTKSTPVMFFFIMLATALPPAPPTPKTTIRG